MPHQANNTCIMYLINIILKSKKNYKTFFLKGRLNAFEPPLLLPTSVSIRIVDGISLKDKNGNGPFAHRLSIKLMEIYVKLKKIKKIKIKVPRPHSSLNFFFFLEKRKERAARATPITNQG
jgi:hypothetical protein